MYKYMYIYEYIDFVYIHTHSKSLIQRVIFTAYAPIRKAAFARLRGSLCV